MEKQEPCCDTRRQRPWNGFAELKEKVAGKPSIYTALRAYALKRAPYPSSVLGEYTWDGTRGHDAGGREIGFSDILPKRAVNARASAVFSALLSFLRTGTAHHAGKLYEKIICETITAEQFVALRRRILEKPLPHAKWAAALAEWLARKSPDRNAVVFAIALMNASPPGRHTQVLDTLALCGRFVWMALAVRERGMEEREKVRYRWNSLKRSEFFSDRFQGVVYYYSELDGSHLLDPLFSAQEAEIKRWLLQSAYPLFLPPYLAYGCAGAGGLLYALRRKKLDKRRLPGLGAILTGIFNYTREISEEYRHFPSSIRAMAVWDKHLAETHGSIVEAVELWLEHVRQSDSTDLRLVEQIDFIKDRCRVRQDFRGTPVYPCWTPKARRKVAGMCSAILAEERWRTATLVGMAMLVPYKEVFSAAWCLGMDTWEYRFRAQEAGHGYGGYVGLMNSQGNNDPKKRQRVIALLEQQMDVSVFACDPFGEESFLKKFYGKKARLNLECLRGLRYFPGLHPEYVAAALNSPNPIFYHPAAKVMSAWGKALWTEDMIKALLGAIEREVYPGIRKLLQGLLRLAIRHGASYGKNENSPSVENSDC